MMTHPTDNSKLPPEILERITYFADGYVMCVLGINPYSTELTRNGMFLSGGPGVALDQIFLRGGDLRALMTLRKMGAEVTPADLVIAKAVATRSPKILARVFAIWSTTESDIGLHTSMVEDFRFGVDNITCSSENYGYIVGYRNVYYLNRGIHDRIHENVDVPYRIHPEVDQGLPATKEAYDKIYPYENSHRKMRMAVKMGRMEDVYHLLDSGETYIHHMDDTIGNLSTKEIIGLYNRYVATDEEYYDVEIPHDTLVVLCGRVSTLEELDDIHKDTSDGYTQVVRYFTDAPGYIHPVLTGAAIDTGRDVALENIIRGLQPGDEDSYRRVIYAMEQRGWTLDMIADQFGNTPVTRWIIMRYMKRDKVEFFKEGLMSLDDLLLTGTIMAESLKELDHDITRDIIHRASKITVGCVDELLWIWHEFGEEMTMGSMDKGTPYISISEGTWSYPKICGREFMGCRGEVYQKMANIYLCWRAYNI